MDKDLMKVRAISLASRETVPGHINVKEFTRFGDFGGYKGLYDFCEEDIIKLCEVNGRDYVWDYVRRNNPDINVDFRRLEYDLYYGECLDKARFVRNLMIDWLKEEK